MDDNRMKELGGGNYFHELLERIRDIRASEKVFYRQVLEIYATSIADDLNGLTPSAWILWQVIDSHICRDGYLGRKDTGMVNTAGGYWGTAVADHDRQELILTMKYYVLGQFIRSIRPGSRLIEMKGPAVAALEGTGKRLTVVAINQEEKEKTARLDVTAFGNAFPAGSRVRSIRRCAVRDLKRITCPGILPGFRHIFRWL